MPETSNDGTIPVIRLERAGTDSSLAQTLREACEEVGFFFLVGHGIEQEFLEEVLRQSRKLFDLPVEAKRAMSDSATSRGYTAMEEETLDPANQTRGDTKEGAYLANTDARHTRS